MRVVFMGTPEIAAGCLRALSGEADFEIVGVYTKPDQPKGRHMRLTMSEVKEFALTQGYTVYQPSSFRDDAVVDELRALRPDVIAVVAYGKILPQRVLDIPKYGCVNIHASILPQLRGAAPVQWAILNGLDETGVTAMQMDAGMDTGDILEIRKTPIDPYETSQELMGRLEKIGAPLLVDTLRALYRGQTVPVKQNSALASYAPMLTKQLSPIDWTQAPRRIIDQIRGLNPWPVASTQIGGKNLKIYSARYAEGKTDKLPGQPVALEKEGLLVACGGGSLIQITQLQAEGGKRMSAADYFRGHPIQ